MLNFFIKKNPHTKNFQTKKKPKRNTDKCFSSGPGVGKPQFKVMQRGHRKLHPHTNLKEMELPPWCETSIFFPALHTVSHSWEAQNAGARVVQHQHVLQMDTSATAAW